MVPIRLRKMVALVLLLGACLPYSACSTRMETVIVSGEYYEMSFRLPAHWENRLSEWDESYRPPEGERFLWVYVRFRSVSETPIELRRDDFKLKYSLGAAEHLTTILVATGNNDRYLWARDRDYGGVTDEDGFGARYVFSVPKQAHDFVLEITSMPPVELTVR